MVTLRADLFTFRRSMSGIARRQVPFAMAQALNDTAKDVEDDWKRELTHKLDSPTPFTKRGIYIRRATKRLTVAEIGFKDIQARYLKLQMTGGIRLPKRRALLVPAGIRLNKYGNMPRSSVARTSARPDTFVASSSSPKTRHLKPGIYKRPKRGAYRKGGSGSKNRGADRGPTLLVSFKGKAKYRRRLQMRAAAERTVRRTYPRHFATRFRAAMLTAR